MNKIIIAALTSSLSLVYVMSVASPAHAHHAASSVHVMSVADAASTSVTADTPDLVEQASENPVDVAFEIVSDIKSGNWRMVAAGLLALLMMLLPRARDSIPWFSGDRGGAILVGILGLAGALASALATSMPLDAELFIGALGVTWTAVGGYTWIKQIWNPTDSRQDP